MRGVENSPNTNGPGVPLSSQYSDHGHTARVADQQDQGEVMSPDSTKQREMAYAPLPGEKKDSGIQGCNLVGSQENKDLSFPEEQLSSSALEMQQPMPLLAKKKFTPF